MLESSRQVPGDHNANLFQVHQEKFAFFPELLESVSARLPQMLKRLAGKGCACGLVGGLKRGLFLLVGSA